MGEAAFGAVVGIVLGQAAGRLTHHLPGGGIVRRYEGIYALGVGLLAYGVADVTFGNGLIAAFVCGISLAVADHDIADDFVVFSENVSSILQVLTFFAFGALIVATGYHASIPLLDRLHRLRAADRASDRDQPFLRGGRPAGSQQAFIAWFGPKGVAGILFAELVLNSDVRQANAIFETAAFVILASIVDSRAHGHARRQLDRAAGLRRLAAEELLLLFAELGGRQDALLLQLAQLLQPLELGVVWMHVVV